MIDVRRLAAVDMHGAHGSALRRRVIVAEFVLGTIGCGAFSVWALAGWEGATGIAVGFYALGLAVNYFVLALHAIALTRTGALEAELRGVDIRAALRHYTVVQIWVFIPGLFAIVTGARLTGD